MQAMTAPDSAAETAPANKAFTRYLPAAARIFMGLTFFVFGLNGFLNFMPAPTDMPERAMTFFGGLTASIYMMPLISGTQLLVGILLLINRFVPLALALIAPVIVNIVAYHVFVQPAGFAPGAIITLLEIYLAWVYRNAFRPMLAARARPNSM